MLSIYKASAGSGKTFTLVLEYFILIFSENDGYKNTLAVTFTNKATEEMKLRIIEELYVLALGNGKSRYEDHLLGNEKLIKAKINTKQALYAKAKELLKEILHDYSNLSVTTIDHFFQKLIRSFIRELKQSPSYAIELDTDNVLAIAIQRVIDRIPNEPSLQKWAKGFIDNSIDKSDKVQVATALTSIGKTLFSENTMEIEKSLFTYHADDIDALYKKAQAFIQNYKDEYYKMCNRFFETLFVEGFKIEDLSNKAVCKREMQKMLQLPVRADVPVISMITRLVSHKGLELVKQAIEDILAEDVQFVLLGTGDTAYEDFFKDIAKRYAGKTSVNIAFNGALSRQIYSGSDIFLMPSISEPCGLSQMICSRYATIPVVRETGGLYDSIKPFGAGGNGFTFASTNPYDMLYVVHEALDAYKNKETWTNLMKKAGAMDFSWLKSAEDYKKLYEATIAF